MATDLKQIKNKIIEELIQSQVKTRGDLDSLKRKFAKKYKIPCPTNVELLKAYHKMVKDKSIKPVKTIEDLLKTRPVRSLSGIVNVSVLTKPYSCPGKCIYCPDQKDLPKSYLRGEPAVERAVRLKFDPYQQVQARLSALKITGHPVDKIELRIIGGTWSYYPKRYQTWFLKECFRASNQFLSKNQMGNKIAMAELTHIQKGKLKKDLVREQKENERSKWRIVGITVETRPDYINLKEIKRMRELGITRVELGVQSIYDDVLKLVKRGHDVCSTIRATKLLKDAGFKVCYQMMPNLPGSDFQRDLKMFEEIFENPDFRPDLLKIYPLALVKQSLLYQWYQKGKFKPYSKKQLIELLIEIKKRVPQYCRIQRIVRDIPSKEIIEGGSKILNLRELVKKKMELRGLKCHCIRCREVRENYNPQEKLYLFREDYQASEGREIFLSFENKKRTKLYALSRLRIPSFVSNLARPSSQPAFPLLKGTAIIREVHTYGQMVPVGEKSLSPQHRGLGKKLIKTAEKIAQKEFGLKKIAVISGIGVRNYYRKLGYRLRETYMVKKLK